MPRHKSTCSSSYHHRCGPWIRIQPHGGLSMHDALCSCKRRVPFFFLLLAFMLAEPASLSSLAHTFDADDTLMRTFDMDNTSLMAAPQPHTFNTNNTHTCIIDTDDSLACTFNTDNFLMHTFDMDDTLVRAFDTNDTVVHTFDTLTHAFNIHVHVHSLNAETG
ncbi:hypothetical protein DFH94DRAFT_797135 [Russula ochroleuca]|uniref:Uncharacterized protein n=1 Tax=Russula ochroleuca TaxID=152965 RepID=A0A9P5TE30_9AGAM|nr:hypothetical protein DFH94DRAFT_797135 [Russula ochroleuca]